MASHRLPRKSWLLVPGLITVVMNVCAADDAPLGVVGPDSGDATSNSIGSTSTNTIVSGVTPEVKQHQDDRAAALTRMEQLLKIKSPSFLTEQERVNINTGKTTPPSIDTSKLTTELAALVSAVNQIKAARAAAKVNPNTPLNLQKITADLESAMALLDKKDANELAADLLLIGLKTVERTDLVGAQPGKLLPLLMRDFVAQLGVGDLFGVAPVTPPQKQAAKFTPPAQQTQQQQLESQLKASAAKFKCAQK
ncbi:MAG: hypothetical protein JSS49_10200 [Planctomycetes bacterium]|nr:hypothetical protein [Planctomycetota bacterium]